MSQIRITPEELRAAATFLDGKRDEITAAIADVKNKIDETTANWEGAAQSSFVEGFEEMYNPTLSTNFPEILEGISAQLNAAADAMESTDQEVASSFRG